MGHEITETDTVLLGEGRTAWHDLGIVREGLFTLDEAHRVVAPWEPVERELFYLEGGRFLPIPERKALVRPDTGLVLGVPTDEYGTFPNAAGFALADAILTEGRGAHQIENVATAGTLRGGRLVWVLLKHERELDISGDRLEPYLLVRWSHDGSTAVCAATTAVRVVCKNTWNAAEARAQRSWRGRHSGSIEQRAREARYTLQLADEYLDELEAEIRQLMDTVTTNARFEQIVREEFPIADDLTQRAAANRERRRDEVLGLWRNDERVGNFRETGWGAVQAFSTWEEHSRPVRGNRSERRALRSISGSALLESVRAKVLA